MENNTLFFSGRVEFVKERHAPNTNWGSLNARVHQSRSRFDFGGEIKTINSPTIWLTIKTDYENGVMKRASKFAFDACNEKLFIFVNGAKITDYDHIPKDANGNAIAGAPMETRYNVEISASGCSFSERPYSDINIATLSGDVVEASEGKFKLKIPYVGKTGLKFRHAVVMTDRPHDPGLIGKRVFVSGEVFGKTPAGTDLVYVVAKQYEVIR